MLLPPREQRNLVPPSVECKAHGGTVLCVAEIGMYRCTQQQHTDRMRGAEARLVAQAGGSEPVAKMLRAHFSEHDWVPWFYNEVVGWVRVFVYPRQRHSSPIVSGEYFAVDAKRLSASLKHKRFLWAGEAFAVVIEHERGTAIFDRVTREIESWRTSRSIRKLTLDLAVWRNIGQVVNWDRLLNIDKPD
jgi:hypothetical protein